MDNGYSVMFYDKVLGGVVFIPQPKPEPALNGDKNNVIDFSKITKTEKQS